MVMALVFFILTVVEVAIVSTTGFPSNVHELMTPDEIFQTFGTDDVPEYQVFPIRLPGARKRRQADDEIRLNVDIDGKEINLNFKPTDGYLATRYTPVWLAITDPEAYNKIRYDPLSNAMGDIGEFKMYQDVHNVAAIVVYAVSDINSIIEGVVTSNYAIKSLPKRLYDGTRKIGSGYFIETPGFHKRSIEPDADEDTGYYVLFKTSPLSKNATRSAPIDLAYNHKEKHQRSRRSKRIIPKAVYPEILIILDHNAIRHHSITEAVRFVLTFWNSVDMVYSALNRPKVHLNIAGIIISADDAATPYIANDTSIKIRDHCLRMVDEIGTYFYNEQVRFPLTQYDMIMAMTTTKLCHKEIDPCELYLGFANSNAACPLQYEMEKYKLIRGTGVLSYNWMFGGVHTAVHETAHMFGVEHDEGEGLTADCHYTEGYAMTPAAEFSRESFKWSACSSTFFDLYFSSRDSMCLDNKPIWTTPVVKVLPGRWLTMDGQCQNSGFEKACQFRKVNVCKIKGCKREGSNDCIVSEVVPMAGSKCGENKYCDLRLRCTSE